MAIKRLISRAEFSRQAGVSRMAVTKACSGALEDAVDGKSIDIDHPSAIAYIKSKRTKKTPTPAKKVAKAKTVSRKKSPPPETLDEEPYYSKDKEIERVMHLTLREIIEEYGTDSQFKVWVDAKAKLLSIKTDGVKLAVLEKTLIPRELVENHIFGAMETSNLRLLRDTAKAATRKIFTLAKAGGSLDEGELLVRKLISDQLKNVAPTFKRILKNA